MMIYSWMTYDSKLLNLENFYPLQPVDLDASMERDTWMDPIDIDHVKSKNQDKEVILDEQKPLNLLNLNGAETST